MSDLAKFIAEELRKRRKDYLSSPTYLLEHYNNEKGNVEAYNGRQLLEMLQNADDASESADEKKVSIKLIGNELTIYNNGDPFTEDGFSSIIYSNASPKIMQQNKIGQKGLGFRSILSWADEVTISSGGTSLAFSQNIAREFLKTLTDRSAALAEFIKEKSTSAYPIATLRIPKLIELPDEENQFDTTIKIKLKDDILDEVQSQILSIINKETLIFLNHIEVIEITSPDRNIIFRKHYEDETRSVVTVESNDLNNDNIDSKTWNVRRKKGTHKAKNYELAIAWNSELDDAENVLFSYFKTAVSFPFPALLHGTFELTPDRNNLAPDTAGHNRFLTTQLADLLIESSLEIASLQQKANYLPLQLLNVNFDSIDVLLKQFHFKEILLEKIKTSSIFPSVNGNYFSYCDTPVFYNYPVADILTGPDVNDLMPTCSNEAVISFLSVLNYFHYSLEKFIDIIAERIPTMPMNQLAHLYYHLLTYAHFKTGTGTDKFDPGKLTEFLIDADKKPIAWGTNIFIQPDSSKKFTVPRALNIRFVHPDLVNLLLAEFEKTDIDFIVKQFAPYGVKKYSFIEVAETIIRHYNAKGDPSPAEVKEMHTVLFRLYKREGSSRDSEQLDPQLFIPAITLTGRVRDAREMYFGTHYGHGLTERIYAFDKSRLLAHQQEFGLENEQHELVNHYFLWIGIEDLPRYTKVDMKPGEETFSQYKEHVLRNYDYRKPNDHNERYQDYTNLMYEIHAVTKITVGHFDDLKRIMSKAKPETILEWINRDTRLHKTLEGNCETLSYTGFQLNAKGKTNYRTLKGANISSYTRWLIATADWIPVVSGKKRAMPDKCCLSKTITDDFSPYVERPNLPLASLADRLNLPEATVENYLSLVGVHREISSFSIGALYEMLFSLPVSDLEGKVARKIYREIINNFNDSRIDIGHPSYQRFVRDGKMYCQKGNVHDYYPVREAYYIPTKTYGSNVLKLFPLVMIDSKQGAQRIEKLFGIKRLKDISFSINGEPVIHPLHDEFQNEIERFKALVYVLRISKDTNHDIANRLKRMKITLAQELHPNFTHEGTTNDFQLEAYEYITAKRRTNFYISVPAELVSLSQLRDANKFCQSVAEIFATLIETEEYNEFIHDLYARAEFGREPRLLSLLEKDDSTDLLAARKQLDVIDDIRLLFWRAFANSSALNIRTDIKNGAALNEFLKGILKLSAERIAAFNQIDLFNQINDLENLEILHELFTQFSVDEKSFARHFPGIEFSILFKNRIADLKRAYRNDFAYQLYSQLLSGIVGEQEKYFDLIDDYDALSYDTRDGFLTDIESYFIRAVQNELAVSLLDPGSRFSYEEQIGSTLAALKAKQVVLPDALRIRRNTQAYLLFDQQAEILRQIDVFNAAAQAPPANPNSSQIKVAGTTIDYDSYATLAEKVLQDLDINGLSLRTGRTLPVADSKSTGNKGNNKVKTRNVKFDTRNEEQVGFIAELICYHKLVAAYGTENVKWISENAARAYPEKFMTGEAGKGYDIELADKGKVRFIEIKGCADVSEGIYMTKTEMSMAMLFPDKYDLLIVEGPLSSKPYLRHIRSPFKFKKEETIFSNGKLKVFNNSYLIKFRWDE